MEQILINLKTPDWWFTGLFFLVVGIIVSKGIGAIPIIWRKLSQYIPALNRGISRRLKLGLLKKIRQERDNDLYITWVIGRYWSIFILSAIYTALILFFFAISKDFALGGSLQKYKIVFVVPIYAFTIFVKFEKKHLFGLIRENQKIKNRITNSLSRSLRSLGRAKSTRAP